MLSKNDRMSAPQLGMDSCLCRNDGVYFSYTSVHHAFSRHTSAHAAFARHPRDRGDPSSGPHCSPSGMDSCLRRNDGVFFPPPSHTHHAFSRHTSAHAAFARHPRDRGDPSSGPQCSPSGMDSCLCRNDGVYFSYTSVHHAFSRHTSAHEALVRHPRDRGNPSSGLQCSPSGMDSCLRRNDGVFFSSSFHTHHAFYRHTSAHAAFARHPRKACLRPDRRAGSM